MYQRSLLQPSTKRLSADQTTAEKKTIIGLRTHTHTHSTNTHTHIEKCNLTYLKEIEEVSSMSIHETKERVSNYNP